MKYTNILYEQFKEKGYSQTGEEGMIKELLRLLEIDKGIAVEVGAGDGQKYSNTLALVKRGFETYMIEKDEKLYGQCKELSKNLPIIPCYTTVDLEENNINVILDKLGCPPEIDFMSIDVDSIDYWIWEQLTRHPKIVCIEIEPRYHPLDMKFHNPEGDRETNPPQNLTGAGPMLKLAYKKGYTLVGMSILNLFFVRNDWLDKLPKGMWENPFQNFNSTNLSKEDKDGWEKYG